MLMIGSVVVVVAASRPEKGGGRSGQAKATGRLCDLCNLAQSVRGRI